MFLSISRNAQVFCDFHCQHVNTGVTAFGWRKASLVVVQPPVELGHFKFSHLVCGTGFSNFPFWFGIRWGPGSGVGLVVASDFGVGFFTVLGACGCVRGVNVHKTSVIQFTTLQNLQTS